MTHHTDAAATAQHLAAGHHLENGVWFTRDGWSVEPMPRAAVYVDPMPPELANPYRWVDGYSVTAIGVDNSSKT